MSICYVSGTLLIVLYRLYYLIIRTNNATISSLQIILRHKEWKQLYFFFPSHLLFSFLQSSLPLLPSFLKSCLVFSIDPWFGVSHYFLKILNHSFFNYFLSLVLSSPLRILVTFVLGSLMLFLSSLICFFLLFSFPVCFRLGTFYWLTLQYIDFFFPSWKELKLVKLALLIFVIVFFISSIFYLMFFSL